jgi:dipeptidyl aminopeptidase/acylaminoacyl peptidase
MRMIIVSLALCTCLAAQSHRLTLEDLVSPEPVGESVLSPDGRTFAMTRSGQIALMPSSGGWPVTLTSTAGAKSGLSWSPDGRSIAFASQGGIWVVSSSGGTPRRLTNAAPGPGDPREASDRQPQFSPKGRWILFETGRRGHNNLMVVSEDGMVSNYLTGSNVDEENASWCPDGAHISYTERTPEHFSGFLNIIRFDPLKGQAADDPISLYKARTDRGGGWSIPKAHWSPDGKWLAVILQESGWNNVYLIPTAGGAPRPLTHGDWEDSNPEFSPDGKSLAIVSNRNAPEESHIWIVQVEGAAARVQSGSKMPSVDSSPQWSPDSGKIYFHRSAPDSSTDLVEALLHGDPRMLTHTTPLNFNRETITMPQLIHYQSKDGAQIAALLYKPREFKGGAKYPAVLWIHGGPEGQDTFRFDPWAQYLAQSGYVVLEPNYRGSTGYGEKFRNLNVEDSGGGEMDDVAAGAEYLVREGIADPKRLAIGGGSHGGTMVGYAVTKYPDLFAAAIELYGVVDRTSFIERTNRGSAIRWTMKMGGPEHEKPEVYRKANTLLDVAKIKTPLLIMHGENDPQVPPYESAQFVRALKAQAKTYYYFTYPNELHGFTQRDHRLDAWRKQLAFLEKYIQPRVGASSTSTDDLISAPASTRPNQ